LHFSGSRERVGSSPRKRLPRPPPCRARATSQPRRGPQQPRYGPRRRRARRVGVVSGGARAAHVVVADARKARRNRVGDDGEGESTSAGGARRQGGCGEDVGRNGEKTAGALRQRWRTPGRSPLRGPQGTFQGSLCTTQVDIRRTRELPSAEPTAIWRPGSHQVYIFLRTAKAKCDCGYHERTPKC